MKTPGPAHCNTLRLKLFVAPCFGQAVEMASAFKCRQKLSELWFAVGPWAFGCISVLHATRVGAVLGDALRCRLATVASRACIACKTELGKRW